MDYKNIIWVEDFDDKNPIESSVIDDLDAVNIHIDRTDNIKEYFPKEYVPFVDLKDNLHDALDTLESNFGKYDCVIFDIDLNRGISKDTIYKVKEKLELNGVTIIDNERFIKDAGYYLYLYLLKKGFPSERVAILTGNYGKDNTSGDWEKRFNSAGLVPPKSIPKNAFSKSELKTWLEERYSSKDHANKISYNYYKLRSNIIGLCGILYDNLNEDMLIFNKKYRKKQYEALSVEYFRGILEDIMNLPLTPINGDEKIIYYNIANKISRDWESAEIARYFYPQEYDDVIYDKICLNYRECVFDKFGYRRISNLNEYFCINKNMCKFKKVSNICTAKKCLYSFNYKINNSATCRNKENCEYEYSLLDSAYQAVMNTIRNWIAHNKLTKSNFDIATAAFILGIGLRAFFDVDKLPEDKKQEYDMWENLIVNLINNNDDCQMDKNEISDKIKKSCMNLFEKIKISGNIAYTSNIGQVIHNIGSEKSNIICDMNYIFRLYIHSLFPIRFIPMENVEVSDYGFRLKVSTDYLNKTGTIELQYFKAIFKKLYN